MKTEHLEKEEKGNIGASSHEFRGLLGIRTLSNCRFCPMKARCVQNCLCRCKRLCLFTRMIRYRYLKFAFRHKKVKSGNGQSI